MLDGAGDRNEQAQAPQVGYRIHKVACWLFPTPKLPDGGRMKVVWTGLLAGAALRITSVFDGKESSKG